MDSQVFEPRRKRRSEGEGGQIHITLTAAMIDHYYTMGGGNWIRDVITDSMLTLATPEKQAQAYREKTNYYAWIDRGLTHDQAADRKAGIPPGYLPQMERFIRRHVPAAFLAGALQAWVGECIEAGLVKKDIAQPVVASLSANSVALSADADAANRSLLHQDEEDV